jgi:NAD(P)H-dependent FMN reductase
MLKLHSIICSTRPGRVGPLVARWFHEFARSHGKFEATLLDLAEFNLPLYDEPHHPRTRTYTKEHTKAWARSVAAADAYVFVTPEYNYCPPPEFVNALDYVYMEWNYKPCGFVSYGGLSGGMRAVQMEKQLVTTLKMMPMVEGVAIPMVAQALDAKTGFKSNEHVESAAKMMLDELFKWAQALKPMRA